MSQLNYWMGFDLIPGIGRARFARLIEHFGDLERAWSASPAELAAAGLDKKLVDSIIALRPKISPEDEVSKLERHKVRALTWDDPEYPARLKEIYDLPPLLYMRGELTDDDRWAIAVVGTRRPTAYGREVTERLVRELVASRVTIISGLARGIDTVAHRAALDAGGRTIAVLGCGLDMVYPAENVKLAQEIAGRGAVVCDYPLCIKPRPENFPRRNRIISGLSLGVLVTEAGRSSGALITANLALEQNREVFAVPGSVLSSQSEGTNRIIQEGAKLVREAGDVLEELNLTMIPQQMEMREIAPENETESLLLKHLSHEPMHIDEMCRSSRLPVTAVSSALAIMELKGMVRQMGNMNYVLSRETRADYDIGSRLRRD
ncbi:DNA-processing protein DprA [Chloroflexota bacterium]